MRIRVFLGSTMKNHWTVRSSRYSNGIMQSKCTVLATRMSAIFALIIAAAVYAENNPAGCCDSTKTLNLEEFFRKHSWILPIETPTNPKSGWSKSKIDRFSLHFDCQPHTPVRAVASGKVLYTGWYGSYGNVTIIGHDGGLATLYAHLSQTLFSKDEAVLQGQTIALTGSTGFNTGSGSLRFEIRKDGKPLEWDKTEQLDVRSH